MTTDKRKIKIIKRAEVSAFLHRQGTSISTRRQKSLLQSAKEFFGLESINRFRVRKEIETHKARVALLAAR